MTFNNSILSGTTLARENIQSEGYTAGVSGWIVERDGDAEFNSIIVRGDVISVGALYTTRILDGEIIIELNSNPVDNVTFNREGFTFNDAGSGGFTMLDYVDGEGLGFRDNSSTRGVYYDNDSGYFVVAETVPWTIEGWNNLTLVNSWVTDVETPGYRLMPDGTILLRGNMKDGTTANGTTLATLPVGYRPLTAQRFITAEKQTGLAYRHIAIDTAGVIRVWNATTAHICLDGVRFPVI